MTKGRSFADKETHFYIPHHVSTNRTCGAGAHHAGQPTGEVVCEECYETAMDHRDIHHKPSCSQFDVMDQGYWRNHDLEEMLAEEYSGEELQRVVEEFHDRLDVEKLPCECVDEIEANCSLQGHDHAHGDD